MNARIVSVSGGSPPLAVRGREVAALAERFDETARVLATAAARTAGALGDVRLLESAPLSPASFAEVETSIGTLASATLACAAPWASAAFGSRELMRTVRLADLESATAMRGIDRLVAAAAVADPAEAAPLVLADPPLFQHVVDGLPTRLVARLLGGWSESGVQVVAGVPACGRSPQSVAELLDRLQQVDDMGDGTIDIQTHLLPDGTRLHVVYLPGTDQMWSEGFTSAVRDMKENGRILGEEPTAHGAGVQQALALAGVAADEPVLLVGHSQGGMQAAQLLAQGSGYHVTNVVTAGSPIAGAGPYPAGSHVLSLENRADLVPYLDGADNPGSPEQVTVRFDDGPDDPIGSHDLSHYVDGAMAVDSSADAEVRASVASLQPFFAPAQVTSRLFVMTRDVSASH